MSFRSEFDMKTRNGHVNESGATLSLPGGYLQYNRMMLAQASNPVSCYSLFLSASCCPT